MSERIEPLAGERQRNESGRAVQACNDYLRLGPGRTLPALFSEYTKTPQNSPSRSLGSLKKWSQKYGWQQRAESYDAHLEAEKNARAREMMSSGLALAYERVGELKVLSDFLKGQLYEPGDEENKYPNVWLPDVKQIGSGDSAERVDFVRFNAPLIEQYRETLDDLAKETGGRKSILEATGKDGTPLVDLKEWLEIARKNARQFGEEEEK